jgi:hypothetical protein
MTIPLGLSPDIRASSGNQKEMRLYQKCHFDQGGEN